MTAASMRDHARAMDAMYRSQRHIYDATRKFYLLGRDRLIAELAPPRGGTVVEVGCGTARNLIAAARRWPQARFHGIDISPAMLDTARAAVERAGLSGRITLGQGDAAAFIPQQFGLAEVDRIFLSYTLSMIPDWRGAIDCAATALAPGGRIEIVDFGQQERLPSLWRPLLFAWLKQFEVTPRTDLAASLCETARRYGYGRHFTSLLRGYAWRATLTRPAASPETSGPPGPVCAP